MGGRRLDVVKGTAIDNENTSCHHQLLSASLGHIHYTVFYAPEDSCPDFRQPENFQELMRGETICQQSHKNEITRSYNKFLNTIRPHGKAAGFKLGVPAKALTFDIAYNQKFKPVGFTYRPTVGIMTRKMTCREADKKLHKETSLQLIQNVARGGPPSVRNPYAPPFEKVIGNYSDIIGKAKLQDDLFEQLDCVFRNDDPSIYGRTEKGKHMPLDQWLEVYAQRFSSIIEHIRKTAGKVPANATMPTTSGRTDVDYFNIMTSFETAYNDGVNPFPVGTAASVAGYRRHALTWNRMGLG